MKNGHTTRQKAPAGRYALLDELRGLDLVSILSRLLGSGQSLWHPGRLVL